MALNVSTYIFGRLSSGYTQFPDDNITRDVFGYAGNRLRAESQLYVHRDNAIIYYVFIRRLPANKYIGLCVVFNGIYITDLKRVFSIFEETIDYCATYGYLIKPKEDEPSTYEPNSAKLYLSKDDVDRITHRLYLEFSILTDTSSLPPVDYGVSGSSVFEYNYNTIDGTMATFVSSKPHSFIYKDENFFSERNQGLIGTISKLNKEKSNLEVEKKELQKEYNALKRKQKNTYWIWGFSFLAVIFLAYLWNTVFFPSEVTNKDMGEYNYYGEMRNGIPNGRGVAFFGKHDKDERSYYVGKFSNGEIHDDNGLYFYKDGSVFNGKIYKDFAWDGIYVNPVDSFYYVGTLNKNGNYKIGTAYSIVKKAEYTDKYIVEYNHSLKQGITYLREANE